jgi:hypothetical protein
VRVSSLAPSASGPPNPAMASPSNCDPRELRGVPARFLAERLAVRLPGRGSRVTVEGRHSARIRTPAAAASRLGGVPPCRGFSFTQRGDALPPSSATTAGRPRRRRPAAELLVVPKCRLPAQRRRTGWDWRTTYTPLSLPCAGRRRPLPPAATSSIKFLGRRGAMTVGSTPRPLLPMPRRKRSSLVSACRSRPVRRRSLTSVERWPALQR